MDSGSTVVRHHRAYGPYIATADEMRNSHNFNQAVIKQADYAGLERANQLIFGVPDLIAVVSETIRLGRLM